jgi:hypothetical protein
MGYKLLKQRRSANKRDQVDIAHKYPDQGAVLCRLSLGDSVFLVLDSQLHLQVGEGCQH